MTSPVMVLGWFGGYRSGRFRDAFRSIEDMPSDQLQSCDGILDGAVSSSAARLDNPAQVFLDPASYINLPESWSRGKYYSQISECTPIWRARPVWKYVHCIDAFVMYHTKRLQVVFQGMSNNDCFRIDQVVQCFTNGG